MLRRRNRNAANIETLVFIIGFALFCGVVWRGDAEAQDIALIMHKKGSDEMSLRKEEVKQIFLGQKTRWDDHSIIHFAVCTEETSLLTFLKRYVKKTPIQNQNYWKKLVFSGKGIMPKMFDDTQKVLEFVSSTEGSISFISAQAVDAQRVTIITVSD